MEKWLTLIRKYPWIDLLWFGIYRLRVKVMEIVSALWFRGKCTAMGIAFGRRGRVWGEVQSTGPRVAGLVWVITFGSQHEQIDSCQLSYGGLTSLGG